MSKIDVKKLKRSGWWTITVLTFSAALCVVIGATVFTFGLLSAVSMKAGFFGPSSYALAQAVTTGATALVVGLALVPGWALIGGWLIASASSGDGFTARGIGVKFLPDDHLIHLRTNELASELSLPPIKWVGWFEDDAINAFAVGVHKENALIAFSRGAIEKLTKEQLDAVVGHELGHVASNDMARMTYARGIQESLTWFLLWRGFKNLARWLFTPLSELEILRHSREREYWADAVGAALVSPEAMIGALQAIQDDKSEPARRTIVAANLMFRDVKTMWSTHPKIDARIDAIRSKRINVSASTSQLVK